MANNWPILDENERKKPRLCDCSVHSSYQETLKWKKLLVRVNMLPERLDKPDLWDDPVRVGKISHEHSLLTGKINEVKTLEQELVEHIDMIKLSLEENDPELKLMGFNSSIIRKHWKL